MSNGVPPPSTKPVWPIVVACLVLVVGIMVAAVFIGMNLSDSDDDNTAADHGDPPSYAAENSGSKHKTRDKKDTPKPDDKPKDSGSDQSTPPDESDDDESAEPSNDPPESNDVDPRLDCGSASPVLTTRTAEYGASICRTDDGDYIYRGMSVNIDGSLVLDARLDKATDTWVATNESTQYTIDADTGHVTIRDTETGEVKGSQASIEFHTE